MGEVTSVGEASLLATSAPGVHVSPGRFERVVSALRDAMERRFAPPDPQVLFVPPVIDRSVIERVGYVRSFPNLLGTVHSFKGTSREWRGLLPLVDSGEWVRAQSPIDLVLLPATCYYVYLLLAGSAPERMTTIVAHGTCFREEATAEAGRLRSFRMSELVTIGSATECAEWRDSLRDRFGEWFGELGLDVVTEVASDPFFGPAQSLLREVQQAKAAKWELMAPLGQGVQAIASCNAHADQFGRAFGISWDGEPAHTACAALGLDRTALALVQRHGGDPDRWPRHVTSALSGQP